MQNIAAGDQFVARKNMHNGFAMARHDEAVRLLTGV